MVNIIGGGLAGSFVAKELGNRGIDHRVFDCGDQNAASRWSENLYVESWLQGNPSVRSSLEWLYDNYRVRLVNMWNGKKGYTAAHHIPVNETTRRDPIAQTVTNVLAEGLMCGETFYEGCTVICAGSRSNEIAKMAGLESPPINAAVGHVFLVPGTPQNRRLGFFMRTYRPYKHEKVMPWYDGRVRYADSLVVTEKQFADKGQTYIDQAAERMRVLGLEGDPSYHWGRRPWVAKHKTTGLHLRSFDNRVHLLTGGFTNGMILYPELARRVADSLEG